MSVILILIPVSLVFATAFLGAFFWAVRSGQYEDTSTPSIRLLGDDGAVPPHASKSGPVRSDAAGSRQALIPFNHED
ncbi:MAG: cbb3-type cytochrome oxidase assembly protein CcoS [Verrucomicrobiales bacterium]|nr:cbb3-type cytochrome oxidase assembly protein CcoS [Verrucomicrobiales bacterium]